MAQTITGATGKPSSVAFGATGLLVLYRTITGGEGIPSTVAFGSVGAILQESSPGAGLPLHTIFIGGVDRTALVRMSSIRRSAKLGSRVQLSLLAEDEAGVYLPPIGDDIQVYEVDSLFFAGLIESTDYEYILGTSARTKSAVRSCDYGVLCDRRVAGVGYSTITGGFLGPTVSDLVDRFLADKGIWYAWGNDDWAPFIPLGEQLFNFCTLTEAFNQIAAKVNGDWRIDFNKRLWFFPKSTGYAAAPVSIVDNDGNLLPPVVVSRSRSRYANRVGVRNNIGRKLVWQDTIAAAGATVVFRLSFALENKPVVTLEGVEQIVEERTGAPPVGDWDFDWQTDSDYLHWNILKPWPVGTVVISYPCPLTFIHWAEDAAEIAAEGRYELIEETRDLCDDTSLDALAAGLLQRYKEEPVSLSFRSRIRGWEPGQLLTLALTKPAVSGTFLVDGVDSQEQYLDGNTEFLHSVRASDAQWQMRGDPTAFFGKLIERTKQPVDRIAQTLRFQVAGTIRGLANPGLETGLAEGIATAQRDGVLAEVKLTFKSIVDGTPTTSTIELDIYQNGVTVFGANKLILLAGTNPTAIQWIFASDPQPVDKGDKFTFEVLQADSAAKDGVLELYIVG